MATLQFYVPMKAFVVLGVETIKQRARAAGVERPSLEYSRPRRVPSHVVGSVMHLTCQTEMARFLVEELRRIAAVASERRDEDLVVKCAQAVQEISREIDRAERPGHDDGFVGIGRAMG